MHVCILTHLPLSFKIRRVFLCLEAHDMGLFLQKVTIIRDYLEDTVEGRAFWPKDVWEVRSDNGRGQREGATL